jgi:hypothetical protein
MAPGQGQGRLVRRVARRLGLEHNALRRSSDRVESSIVVALLIAFLAGAPLLAAAVSRSSYESDMRTTQTPSVQHRATARLTADAPDAIQVADQTASTTVLAPARWTYAGTTHTGKIRVQPGTKAGTAATITVDDHGRPMTAPHSRTEMITRAGILATSSVVGLALGLWLVRWHVRRVLIRRHLGDWEADWAAFGPKWTGRSGV